jgi:hypothetical protein
MWINQKQTSLEKFTFIIFNKTNLKLHFCSSKFRIDHAQMSPLAVDNMEMISCFGQNNLRLVLHKAHNMNLSQEGFSVLVKSFLTKKILGFKP